jgi:uncharacterized protein (DUF2235 family)
MSRRLVVCCDGTWNTPDEVRDGRDICTNVAKLALAVAPTDAIGRAQLVFYDRGVGTAGQLDRVLGGAFGVGLSRNVQESYMFIVQNYEPGDEVFLFGFSRGAYTARSVAGLIRNSGVLRRRYAGQLSTGYQLYRDRTDTTHPNSREARLFRKSYSHEIRIKFIGVWDTVGALGIPRVPYLPATSLSHYWDFHDVTLSSYVDNAFQALAIDELRKAFEPTLWSQQPDLQVPQHLEQVWFAGVHSNVGGGYPDAGLSDVALCWITDRARRCGLAFDEDEVAATVKPCALGTKYDSLSWLYQRLGAAPRAIPDKRYDSKGQQMITRETVASSAVVRWQKDASYRPVNLGQYLDRHGRITQV